MKGYLNRHGFPHKNYPEKIVQFGEGNFLRAFIDWMVDILNEKTDFNSGITIVRPIDTKQPMLNEQDGLYTAVIRGLNEQGQPVAEPRLISSVNREISVYQEFERYLACAENPDLEWIFSNTTEAGISYSEDDHYADCPPATFPAKLTRFLHQRFTCFNGADDKGLIIVPCELIDYNGEKLKEYVMAYATRWQLEPQFLSWLENSNTFCSTLVDRIVTGYPHGEISELEQQLGYQDRFLVTAEYFYLFVIQGPEWLKDKLKLDQVSLNIHIVDDIKPYKERKVGILNGAHTAMMPVAYLAGLRTVGDAMNNPAISGFVDRLLQQEVIPALSLDKDELKQFASDVIARFSNPYIQHELLAISLNSLTKFKTRLLPQLITYQQQYQQVPEYIVFALASLILFYRGEYNGEKIPLTDDDYLLERFKSWAPLYDSQPQKLAENILAMSDHWERDLNQIPGLTSALAKALTDLIKNDVATSIPA
ncbi:tagaturonate reductase [Budvicia aquatica]|uniref:Altronate oxidoreductase n=1 Tax=Budvicia aquatica TaxID=82979 RepID=A0A2C6DIS7_9GAMM|nr:tagaturonate reductase [Budvicia aquatica]PHI29107.1 tagaturonate reductase [Budvicia aquatica]VFS47270.1 Altronate oxidoreductase [Budvicia aquatica]